MNINAKRWTISRHTMLKSSLACLSLPYLDIMAQSRHSKNRVRSAFIYYPNGMAEGSFGAEKVDSQNRILSLKKVMKSLTHNKEKITIPERMWNPKEEGHGGGTASWLTCSSYDEKEVNAGQQSIDQVMASALTKESSIASLELSVRGEGFFSNEISRNNISWRKANLPCYRETEPRAVFDRLFKVDRSSLNSSILDHIKDKAKALQKRGSKEDHHKLEEYLDAIRSLERQLDSQHTKKIKNIEKHQPDFGIPKNHQTYLRQMFDLIVLAFQSEQTRVSSFMLDHGQSNRYCNFIPGVKGTWHALSHWKDFSGKTDDDDGKIKWNSKSEKFKMYSRVVEWHHQQFAYFLSKLDQVKEPGGMTLLDQCQIMYGSNLSDGHEHGGENLPILVAGSAGKKFKTGRVIKQKNSTSLAKLYMSFLKNMGVDKFKFAGERSSISELT